MTDRRGSHWQLKRLRRQRRHRWRSLEWLGGGEDAAGYDPQLSFLASVRAEFFSGAAGPAANACRGRFGGGGGGGGANAAAAAATAAAEAAARRMRAQRRLADGDFSSGAEDEAEEDALLRAFDEEELDRRAQDRVRAEEKGTDPAAGNRDGEAPAQAQAQAQPLDVRRRGSQGDSDGLGADDGEEPGGAGGFGVGLFAPATGYGWQPADERICVFCYC